MKPFRDLHPFTSWRLRRRVKGGVAAGTPAAEVAARLGEPKRKSPGEYPSEEIWTYELATIRGYAYAYRVLVDLSAGVAVASWWAGSDATRADR